MREGEAMTNFAIRIGVLLVKDQSSGKYVKLSTRVSNGRLEKYAELVDDPRQGGSYLDQKEIDQLPEETKRILADYAIVPAMLAFSY